MSAPTPITPAPRWRGELRQDAPLRRHNSWRVGGLARQLYRPADIDDLAAFLASLPADEPLLWLGLGSNLLIRDGGFAGTVILTAQGLSRLHCGPQGEVRVEAGVTCAQLARQCARAGLAGAAFWAGIPGTLGGALAMNAGAFGGETWAAVVAVDTLDRRGQRRQRGPEDYRIGYRSVSGPPDEWFVAAQLRLAPGDAATEQARIRELLARRGASQPSGLPSGGSTFKNPPGDHAARLIDDAGLKGCRLGDAEVSPKHANFIINRGGASAADIEGLIDLVRREVAQRHGVDLEPEVQIVGEPA